MAVSQQPFVCTQCEGFQAPSFQLLLSHTTRAHSGNCRISCCMREFHTVTSYRKHCNRYHQELLQQNRITQASTGDFDQLDTLQGDDIGEDNLHNEHSEERDMRNKALWILKSKETLKLTQVATTSLLDSATELCETTVTELGGEVKALLQVVGIDSSSVPGLDALFSTTSHYCQPFDGIDTYHRQLAYYKKHLNFVVSFF